MLRSLRWPLAWVCLSWPCRTARNSEIRRISSFVVPGRDIKQGR